MHALISELSFNKALLFFEVTHESLGLIYVIIGLIALRELQCLIRH